MWSRKRQAVLCAATLLCTLGLLFLVLQNYEEESIAKVEPRFFKEAVRTRMFELNLLLFLTTLVSACRQSILQLFDRVFLHRCSPLVNGLCRVCIRMACVTLFDFRIIHVMSTSYSLRSSILVADLVSLFLHEALTSYALDEQNTPKRRE